MRVTRCHVVARHATEKGTRTCPNLTSSPCCRRAASSRHRPSSATGPTSAAQRSTTGWCAWATENPEQFWSELAGQLDWFTPVAQRPRLEAALRQVVRRRHHQSLAQLRRPAPDLVAPQQGRHHLRRGARRQPHAHVPRPPPRGLSLRQRPQAFRRDQGRSRRPLPAHDPRAGHRHARLRPHRRDPQRHLRWVQRRRAPRPAQRRQAKLVVTSTGATAGAPSCPSKPTPTPPCATPVGRERRRRPPDR